MAGYVIAQIMVNDPEGFQVYVKKNTAAVAQYGGKFLARGGGMEVLEGECPCPRIIVLEFPSVEAARAWYEAPEFEEVKALRHATSDSHLVLVEGV